MKYAMMELKPNDHHKSFHGKATVEVWNDDVTLYSYGTRILSLNTKTGELKKWWYGWSATTQRHINAFAAAYDVPGITGKAAWLAL